MVVSIETLKPGQVLPMDFTESVAVPPAYGLLNLDVTLSVKGHLKHERDFFSFEGHVAADLMMECGLCLSPVAVPVSFQICDKFSETLETLGEEDVFPIASRQIDLTDAILSGLLMEIPGRVVCSASCKGLCPFCGKDLNHGPCGCSNDEINERFAQLKDLFKEV